MAPTSSARILTWTLDGLILIVAFLIYVVFEVWVEPFHRGFFCDDDSIRYPHKSNTISISTDIAIGATINILTLVAIQLYGTYRREGKFRPCIFSTMTEGFFVYVFGAVSSQATCNIAKVLVGRLRPCFLAVCFPNATDLFQYCADNSHTYVNEFTCAGDVRDYRQSFPSGHTNFIMYSMVFAALYMQRRVELRRKRFKLLVPFFQIVLINGGIAIGLSRISDYRHHWGDVLTGGINGIAFAFYAIFCLLDQREAGESIFPMRIKRRPRNDVISDPMYESPQSVP